MAKVSLSSAGYARFFRRSHKPGQATINGPAPLAACLFRISNHIPIQQNYYWHGLTASLVLFNHEVAQSAVESRFAPMRADREGDY